MGTEQESEEPAQSMAKVALCDFEDQESLEPGKSKAKVALCAPIIPTQHGTSLYVLHLTTSLGSVWVYHLNCQTLLRCVVSIFCGSHPRACFSRKTLSLNFLGLGPVWIRTATDDDEIVYH